MPRRRMIDPEFWSDPEVAQLIQGERLLLLGCLSNADDEGRIKAHPAYLKSSVFMYDDDILSTTVADYLSSMLAKMASWHTGNHWFLLHYTNSAESYLCFPNWFATNKPTHPKQSIIPPPNGLAAAVPTKEPPANSTKPAGSPQDTLPPASSDPHEVNSPSLGQVRSGQYSEGKVSAVQVDFTKFLDSDIDLTDRLTTTLEEYVPRGPLWAASVLSELWRQALHKKMPESIFAVTSDAAKKYSPAVLARSFVKLVKYQGGATGSGKYLLKILEEQAAKEGPREKSP